MFSSNVLYGARNKVSLLAGVSSAALFLFSLLPGIVAAQKSAEMNPSFSVLTLSKPLQNPSTEFAQPALPGAEFFNPFDGEQFQNFLREGLRLQEAHDHQAAVSLFLRAWRVSRIDLGLYHEIQIPILKSLVYSHLELGNYAEVEQQYDYLTHLYQRLYPLEDPRLEAGLQQISSFHINAFNANLQGRQEHHLHKAAVILQLRQEAALATLDKGHPRLEYLQKSIELSKQHLYLLSDRHRELRAKDAKRNRDRLFATLE